MLNRNKITHDYLAKHIVGLTSDGVSAMQGINRGAATKLKKRYPQIVIWHYLNHRLELAVSGTLKVVHGVNQVKFSLKYIQLILSHRSCNES